MYTYVQGESSCHAIYNLGQHLKETRDPTGNPNYLHKWSQLDPTH